MKKIVFFILCFAISLTALLLYVSAAEYAFGTVADPIEGISQKHIFGDEEHGSDVHRDGWYDSLNGGVNNTGFARVMLRYTKDGDTLTVTYPAYYILQNNSDLVWDFSAVSTYLGVELNVGNIVAIEIPYGITKIPAQAFVLPGAFDATVTAEHPKGHVATPNTALEYVFISNSVLEIGDFAFAHCTSLATVGSNVSSEGAAGLHNHQMIQRVGYRAFHDCEKVTSFNFNNHLQYLGEGTFQGCSLTNIDLTKCIELKAIPAYCFHESNASEIKTVMLPNSVEELGDYAFTGTSAQHLFLGTGLKKIGHDAISMADADYVILPVTIETVYDDSISFGNKSYDLYIVGAKSDEDIERLFVLLESVGIDLKQTNNAKKVYSDSLDFFGDTDNPFCINYLGGHTIDHNSTAVSGVRYPDGIEHKGYALGSCGVCGQTLDTEIEITPIVVAKGYSICTFNGLAAFSNGFEVYHDALAIYEAVYGECELGIVFMLNNKYVEGSDLRNDIGSMGAYFDENTLLEGTNIKTYASIDYIMTYSKGLVYEDANGNTVNRGEVQLVISAYLLHISDKAGELKNTSHFVQDTDDLCIAGTTSDGKYVTVSYDSVNGFVQSQNQ